MKMPILPNMQMLQGETIETLSFKSLIGVQCSLITKELENVLNGAFDDAFVVLTDYTYNNDNIKMYVMLDYYRDARINIVITLTSFYLLNSTKVFYSLMEFLVGALADTKSPTEKEVKTIKNYLMSVFGDKTDEVFIEKFEL